MRYFSISTGLRGCYMPDAAYVIAVRTRSGLREALAEEARQMREAYPFGGSNRAISTIAACAWRAKPDLLPFCLPFGRERGDYPFGVFVARIDWKEYQATREQEEG